MRDCLMAHSPRRQQKDGRGGVQCPLLLKSGLRETRNCGEIGDGGRGKASSAAAAETTTAAAARAAGISAAPAVRRRRDRQRRLDRQRWQRDWRRRRNGRGGIGVCGAIAALVRQVSSSSSPAPAQRTPPGGAKEGVDLVQQGTEGSISRSPAPAQCTPPGAARWRREGRRRPCYIFSKYFYRAFGETKKICSYSVM